MLTEQGPYNGHDCVSVAHYNIDQFDHTVDRDEGRDVTYLQEGRGGVVIKQREGYGEGLRG